SSEIVKNIEKAGRSENIKAIIFEVNSGGGAVVASEEIVNAIKNLNKSTVAYIRDVGASGAYWVASATDYIFASRMSVTGSVGVIASYLEFSGFLDRYNITYQRLVSGEYKDLGSPLKKMTYSEEALFQEQLDMIHDYFKEDVAKSRNLSEEAIEEISTAQFFLGIQAKEMGLIDDFGGKQEAIDFIEERLNITAEVSEIVEKRSLLDVLGQVMNEKSFYMGEGIGHSLVNSGQSSLKVWS
ncbi:MAG: signal peptide peptidase SppA, partial [Nanoarchaeota archaeon]